MAAAIIGLFDGFLFDRTLSVAAWAPPLAVAFLLLEACAAGSESAWRSRSESCSSRLADSATFFADKRWDYDLSIEQLEQVVEPGDIIVVRPALYGALVDWRIGVRGDLPADAHRSGGDPRVVGAAPRRP